MSKQKEYKIAELSLLDSVTPVIEYINPNEEFNTMEEANSRKLENSRDTIYLVLELSNVQNNLKSVKK